MRFTLALAFYRLLLPLLFLAAFPGWLLKMLRRGGFGTGLAERAAIYTTPVEFEPCGATHVHAVSVGESLLALKLIREWLQRDPTHRFVLATGTATGHAVATAAAIPGLRVTYAPLDLPSMVRRYFARFEPSQLVLIEGEAWPHLMLHCRSEQIPVALINARMSPRSARRFSKFAPIVRPLFSLLDAVAIQEPEDRPIWENLGVASSRIHETGSLKFDPGTGARPTLRPEFTRILAAFGASRPRVLAASTHDGEDPWIACAIRDARPDALPVIVPRHAERRSEVRASLEREGFHVLFRSSADFDRPAPPGACLVIDTTGELRDWTAHADVVVIGKSFLAIGGQNPAEAILAGKPVVCGPHMENFQPLVGRLARDQACLTATDAPTLIAAIRLALDPAHALPITQRATRLLSHHQGATTRIIDLLTTPAPPHHTPGPPPPDPSP